MKFRKRQLREWAFRKNLIIHCPLICEFVKFPQTYSFFFSWKLQRVRFLNLKSFVWRSQIVRGRVDVTILFVKYDKINWRNKMEEKKKERMMCKIWWVCGFLYRIVSRAPFPVSLGLIVIQISHRSVSDFSAYSYVSRTWKSHRSEAERKEIGWRCQSGAASPPYFFGIFEGR